MVSQLASLFLRLCLQVFIISVLLFKRLSPLYVAISYFSFKHKRQRLLFILQDRHVVKIFHATFGVPLRFLISENSFDSSVLFLWLTWLNDFLWFLKLSNIFVCIQRCHSKCWLDKLCISFDNIRKITSIFNYGSCS